MKRMFKCLCMVLASIFLYTACSPKIGDKTADKMISTQEITVQTEEKPAYVMLKMYLLGSKPEDGDILFAEISKKLTDKINAGIELATIEWVNWDKKYPLLFASGEDFDLIYTSNWAFYPSQAVMGGFYELTKERLAKYCPLTMASLPEEAWEVTKINGKNYMIPNNSHFANHYGLAIRGDLREKYGLPEITTIEDCEVFMDAVLKNEKGMIPFASGNKNGPKNMCAFFLYPNEMFYLGGSGVLGTMVFNFSDEKSFNIKPYYEIPAYLDYLKRMAKWNEKGYFSKSDLTQDGEARPIEGKSAVIINDLSVVNRYFSTAKKEHPEWKIEYVNLADGRKLLSRGFGDGCAVNAASKDPERSMMALDLLGYDPEINFMILFGIPEVHSRIGEMVKVGDREYKVIEDIAGSRVVLANWCWVNEVTMQKDRLANYEELTDSYFFRQNVYHPLVYLAFNPEPVKAQVIATQSILNEYEPILNLGFTQDAEKTMKEFVEKLKAAGIDNVNAELHAQAKALMPQ